MKILGLIPARSGSVRLPGKNVALLGRRTLVEWTLAAARQVPDMAPVVSTDSQEIMAMVERCGGTAIMRPPHLATAEASSIDVLRHAATFFPSHIYALLQPTSPFRTTADIMRALGIMELHGAEAVVSVTDAELSHTFELGHCDRMREVSKLTGYYQPNGAIYLLTHAALADGRDWWDSVAYAYRMPRERSLDIDTQQDLDLARRMLNGL